MGFWLNLNFNRSFFKEIVENGRLFIQKNLIFMWYLNNNWSTGLGLMITITFFYLRNMMIC